MGRQVMASLGVRRTVYLRPPIWGADRTYTSYDHRTPIGPRTERTTSYADRTPYTSRLQRRRTSADISAVSDVSGGEQTAAAQRGTAPPEH
jgi:hypothetical protein